MSSTTASIGTLIFHVTLMLPLLFWPLSQMSAAQSSVGLQQSLGAVARVSYVTGFSGAFGTSVWVTFVAGVVLFR